MRIKVTLSIAQRRSKQPAAWLIKEERWRRKNGINSEGNENQATERSFPRWSEVTDDDFLEADDDGSWFSMGMSKEEKYEAKKPWCMSLIIKLVGRSIGYQL